jgi:hypothetical protein
MLLDCFSEDCDAREQSRPQLRTMREDTYKLIVDRLEREHGNSYDVSNVRLSEWFGNGWFARFTCRAKNHSDSPMDRLAFFAVNNGDLKITVSEGFVFDRL